MYQVNEMNKQINNNMDMRTEIGPKMLRWVLYNATINNVCVIVLTSHEIR